MKVSDLLSKRKAAFVSIYDVISDITLAEDISTSQAASALRVALDIPIEWSFIHRDAASMIVIGLVPDEQFGHSSQNPCIEMLETLATAEVLENSIPEEIACNHGWYKNKLATIFENQSLQPLRCFSENHISPTTFSGDNDYRRYESVTPPNSPKEPNWKHYARLPYLSENECACLLENVNPKLFSIVEADHNGNPISKGHKLSDEVVTKVKQSLEAIQRHTNLGLSATTSSKEWIDNQLQHSYFTANFIEWAKLNNYEINLSFLEFFNHPSKNNSTTPPSTTHDFLDEKHPCYSPKLAAAIGAWEYAVANWGENQTPPTQHMKKWLKDNKNLGFELSGALEKSIPSIANFRDGSSITKEEMQNAKSDMEEYQKPLVRNITNSTPPFPLDDPEIPF